MRRRGGGDGCRCRVWPAVDWSGGWAGLSGLIAWTFLCLVVLFCFVVFFVPSYSICSLCSLFCLFCSDCWCAGLLAGRWFPCLLAGCWVLCWVIGWNHACNTRPCPMSAQISPKGHETLCHIPSRSEADRIQ